MKKLDPFSPEAAALRDAIVQDTFVREGTMVAFPTCFPGTTLPIPLDEARITALDLDERGAVYAGTAGHGVHLLVGMFHGVTGMVFDMGTVAGGESCAAICCGTRTVAAFVNGPDGGRGVIRELEELPFDLIQEWGFVRKPFRQVEGLPGEPILHAVSDASRTTAVGTTATRLFSLDFEKETARVIGEAAACGRLAATRKAVLGWDRDSRLWMYDIREERLRTGILQLPVSDAGSPETFRWAGGPEPDTLFLAAGKGRLFSIKEGGGFKGPLGQAPIAPVGCMAATFDRRIFGTCGTGICRLFCFDPEKNEVQDLGAIASVLQRRRYGYAFSSAATGREGEIVFAEDDNGGHIWLYFPRIKNRRTR